MRASLRVAGFFLFSALAAAQPQTPASARKSRGRSRASSSEGPDLDAAANRQISCPPSFVPEKTGGPHLTLPEKTAAKKKARRRSKKKSDDESGSTADAKTRTLSRRCVPAKDPAKP